jgi:hypothetical protein
MACVPAGRQREDTVSHHEKGMKDAKGGKKDASKGTATKKK